MEQLRQEGYGIESVPNRGYRLTRVTARLRPEELAEQFRDCRIGRELLCFDTIDSTNNELKRRAVSGSVDGTVILADQQTGGRGRRGRSFVSPAGKGLYLSAPSAPSARSLKSAPLTAWTAVALLRRGGVRLRRPPRHQVAQRSGAEPEKALRHPDGAGMGGGER